jgi:hypothetical protein
MEYIAGHVHSKLQQEHYYEIVNSMFISVLKDGNRHSDLRTSDDYDNLTDTIELFENDIICVKYFKLDEYSSVSYSYIEKINKKKIQRESLISIDFIISNENVFKDITLIIKRDKLIDSILC